MNQPRPLRASECRRETAATGASFERSYASFNVGEARLHYIRCQEVILGPRKNTGWEVRGITGWFAQRRGMPKMLNQRMAHDIAQGDLVPMHWSLRWQAARACACWRAGCRLPRRARGGRVKHFVIALPLDHAVEIDSLGG